MPTPGPRLGHVGRRRNYRRGRRRSAVGAPADLPSSYPRLFATPNKNWQRSLHHDALSIPVEGGGAHAFDLAQILTALERPVGLAVVDDSLRNAAAHAVELLQLLHRRGVDVDLLHGRGGDGTGGDGHDGRRGGEGGQHTKHHATTGHEEPPSLTCTARSNTSSVAIEGRSAAHGQRAMFETGRSDTAAPRGGASVVGLREAVEILLPLDGQHRLLAGV